MDGSMFNGLANFIVGLFIVACIAIVGCIVFTILYFTDSKIVKTKTKPTITWELKAHGQKVDTIWVYKFK